jgi:hypothetical protein
MHNQGMVGRPAFGREYLLYRLFIARICRKPVNRLCRNRNQATLPEALHCMLYCLLQFLAAHGGLRIGFHYYGIT